MDSSEADQDEMEAQRTMDMSRDQQEMTLLYKGGRTLSSGGFSQSRRDEATPPTEDTEPKPEVTSTLPPPSSFSNSSFGSKMNSSEACLDGIEAQSSRDVSCDQQKGIFFHMNLLYKSPRSLICSRGFRQSRRDGATPPTVDTKFEPELSALYNLPGEYVAMNSEILSVVRAGERECLEKIKSWETPMGCFKNEKGDSILHIAAASGHLELVNSIVSECPSILLEPNWNDQIPLHVAAHACQSAVIKTLIAWITSFSDRLVEEDRERLNPYILRDKNGDTPLHLALREILMCEQNSIYLPTPFHRVEYWRGTISSSDAKRLTEAAKYLVNADQCASFIANKDGIYPLYLAVQAGKISLVNEMLNHSGNNIHDETFESASQFWQLDGRKSLVHAALESKNIDILDIILKKYPNLVNERDEEGRTCLSVAASVGFYKGLCMLLDTTSSSIFDCDDDGSFPIHRAVEKGHRNVFHELLKRFPESLVQLNKKGQNIFHIAAKNGKVKKFLFPRIVGLNTIKRLMEEQDVDGNTPVHLATINWRPKTLYKLNMIYPITTKVLNLCNADGLRPLDIAEKNLQSDYVFRERMTLMVLLGLYKPKGLSCQPTSGMTLRSRSEKAVGSGRKYKELVDVLLVVAALVATITFAAGFTMPGGFNSSAPNPGMAILVDDENLTTFILYDAMAMYSSIIAIAALIWAQLGDQELAHKAFHLALPSVFIALTFMSMAFAYGVQCTIKPNRMLKNTLLSLHWIFGYGITLLLTPYVIPQISGIPIIKEVTSSYLYLLLMFVNEADEAKYYTSGYGQRCLKRVESPGSSSGNQVEKSESAL